MATKTLLQALAVTCELTNTQISTAAAQVMASDLSKYPEDQVLAALVRCRRELKGRLTIADVLQRLQDGRPGPEEAWSIIPHTEAMSAFWTDEMRAAYFVARPLIESGDMVQARMAFLETYRSTVQFARDAHRPVAWQFTPGTDKAGRELVVIDALEKGRITHDVAQMLLPHHHTDEGVTARLLAAKPLKFLPSA
ncbi:MAG: hypothetical protein OEW90_01020 [Betaproteobacteria bacterium]|nr:hypothetical protein [Betaproteobacteria bacterium]MDH4322699.1 hypothetical protein [Betaproteobacteria bacterium]